MQIKGFSRKELISILEVIDGARRCMSDDELNLLLLKAKELVCADYAVCGRGIIQGATLTSIHHIIKGNYPEAWLSTYMEDKLFKKDPLIKYHARFSMTQFWSDIFKAFDDPDSMTIIKRARNFGLVHGISGGIYSPDEGELSLFVFSGEKDRFGKHQKRVLDLLILHLNRALERITDKEGPGHAETLEKIRMF